MKYKIALTRNAEGVSVSVPGLPGCWSQGATETEAIANISEAIPEYLVLRDELVRAREKAGFRIARQSGHMVMTDGQRTSRSRATTR